MGSTSSPFISNWKEIEDAHRALSDVKATVDIIHQPKYWNARKEYVFSFIGPPSSDSMIPPILTGIFYDSDTSHE